MYGIYQGNQLIDTYTTDENGKFTTDYYICGEDWTIREITVPYGMTLNTEIHTAKLVYAGQEITVTETSASFYNERQKVQIALSKVLEQDKKFGIGMNGEITSVSFGLYASKNITAADGSIIPADGLIEIIPCDENGKVLFNTDIPVGAKLMLRSSAPTHTISSETKSIR